jgi:hypothetical protein
MLPEGAIIRYWKYVIKGEGPDDCWGWAKSKDPDGYGQLQVGDIPWRAHRISFVIHFGSSPAGMMVLHRCDNPECSNPTHLFPGTNADNMADCKAKGRRTVQRGIARGQAKLNDAAVRDIRTSPQTLDKIRQKYGISLSLASLVRRREIWTHVADT